MINHPLPDPKEVAARIRIAKALGINFTLVETFETWVNCLFVTIRKGYKKIKRFVSKKVLTVQELPQVNGLHWLKMPNRKLLVKIRVFADGCFEIFDKHGKEPIAYLEFADGRPLRGFWGDKKLGRVELAEMDFELYNVGGYAGKRGTGRATA